MATKTLQIELLEHNLFVELVAEETMPFSTIITKLKSECHLKPEGIYYIKTPAGMPVKESSAISIFRLNHFIITNNPDWKSPAGKNGSLAEVPEITAELVLNDNKYWILPFGSAAAWDNDEVQTQLFCLNNITTSSGKKMSLNLVLQYSLTDSTLSGNRHISERTHKMRQILTDALNIELTVNNIGQNNFYDNVAKLSGKMHYYLTSYMELKWGTKIEGVSFVGFTEYVEV